MVDKSAFIYFNGISACALPFICCFNFLSFLDSNSSFNYFMGIPQLFISHHLVLQWASIVLKKPIITVNWLHQCWKEHRVVPPESYRVLPFSGLTICVTRIPAG
ncbi:hypothetical protein U1Q18_017685 [Sarracenia purpurea var. burkii]